MKRHLTKQEILQKHKDLADWKHKQLSAPYTGMSIICNYILWNNYGFRHERLQKFNQSINDYFSKLNAEEIVLKELQDRLFDKAEFKVEFEEYTEKDITVNRKNKYLYDLAKKEIAINNEITNQSVVYITIMFSCMMDLGFGKKRLEKLKDEILEMFSKVNNGKVKTMKLHSELMKNGVVIEMPD